MSSVTFNLPPRLIAIAESYGPLIADQELTPGSCRAALASICTQHPDVDPGAFDDTLEAMCNIAERIAYAPAIEAQRDITNGVQDLLQKRAPRAVILKRGYRLAEARLLQADVQIIVDHAIAAHVVAGGGQ